MEGKSELLTVDNIQKCVYIIRGQQVMLDTDLAQIYGYEVKRLNQQVKRNIRRFPEDFMFQLNENEVEELRLQNVTANINAMSRAMPFVFTEQDIYMLSTVLHGEQAEQQSIFIMRAFREMRHYIKRNEQFITQAELSTLMVSMTNMSIRMDGFVDRQKKMELDFENVQKRIEILNENFVSDKDFKNFIIYKGLKFEADAAYIDIYQQAQNSIYVVDDYMNTKTLQLLSQKKPGVEVILFTENGYGKSGFLTTAVVNDFINEYPTLRIKPNPDCHDRLIVLDYKLENEQVFHCGASSKDAGKKLCAINAISDTSMIHPVIDKLMLASDKAI